MRGIYSATSFLKLMANQKMIMLAVAALLSWVNATGFCAEPIGLIEIKETGTIDWARGVVQAKGYEQVIVYCALAQMIYKKAIQTSCFFK